MKTKLIKLSILTGVIISLFIIPQAVCAEDRIEPINATVILNGERLSFSVPLITYNDRTMVPMREIFEKLGANVEWIDSESKIIAKSNTKTIEMIIDDCWTLCNDIDIYVDVPPILYQDKTMVPLRFAGEQLNLKVSWEDTTQTINLDSIGTTTIGDANHSFKDMDGREFSQMYSGELIDGIPYGIGTLITLAMDETGANTPISEYYGCVFDWMPNGYGLKRMSSGMYYSGFHENGVASGIGELYTSDDILLYSGQFENDFPNGIGVTYIGDGVPFYAGEHIDGMGTGYGISYHSNGNVEYEGEHVSFLPHGNCTQYDEYGRFTYQGGYDNGMPKGHGMLVIYYDNGNVCYEGSAYSGLPNGSGKEYYENGVLKYDGQYYSGGWDGYGKYYSPDGVLQLEGLFSYDKTTKVSSFSGSSFDDIISSPIVGDYSSNVIQSRIKGKFDGWKGNTIVELSNGQVWQQAGYEYWYYYAFNPTVTIYKSGTGYKMKVGNCSKDVTVIRLR